MQWVQIDRPCIILPFIHSSRKNLALEFWSFGVCVHSTRMILLFPHYFLYHLCPWIRSYTVFLVCSNYFLTITTSLYMESISLSMHSGVWLFELELLIQFLLILFTISPAGNCRIWFKYLIKLPIQRGCCILSHTSSDSWIKL